MFPGGVLIGCEAGTLNVPKIKGTHTAMKSGMLAAEAAAAAIAQADDEPPTALLDGFVSAFRDSWAYRELWSARNFRPSFKFGLKLGTLLSGIDQVLLRGRAPWTLRHGHADHEVLESKEQQKPIDYPKPDGEITFDRLSSVYISNTNHEENQPPHLTLKDPTVPIAVNLELYDAPEQRYCPAQVYEIVRDDDGSNPGFRSTRRIACTARPATSRTRPKISSGWLRKVAADRTIPICKCDGARDDASQQRVIAVPVSAR